MTRECDVCRSSNGLVIIGAGGHGRVVASVARAAGWHTISFVDLQWPQVDTVGDWPVEGDGSDLTVVGGRSVIVAIGDNDRRLDLTESLERAGLHLATVIHPTAWICPGVSVGAGTVVGAQAVINHGASIGRSAIVNTGAIVEHDCSVADGAHISPGAVLSGGVTVARAAWIGAGASVRPRVHIGERAVIGVGAAVISNVPAGATYVGVPARSIETLRSASS